MQPGRELAEPVRFGGGVVEHSQAQRIVTQQGASIAQRIDPRGVGQFVDEAFEKEHTRGAADAAHEANRNRLRHAHRIDQQIGHAVAKVVETVEHRFVPTARFLEVIGFDRLIERLPHHAGMQRSGHAVLAEHRAHARRRARPVETVLNVIFARTDHLDGTIDRFRGHRRMHNKVGDIFTAETAAEKRGIHDNLVGRQLEHRGHRPADFVLTLDRAPHFDLVVAHMDSRVDRLHGRVDDVRRVIVSLDDCSCDCLCVCVGI